MTEKEFIKKAKEIHNNKYDYSKVEYVNSQTKVCIICPIHGEFWQTPKSHVVRKYGCSKCGRNICGDKLKNTTNKFIEKANKIHNDKYDYSKVEYINAYTKICIICSEHGEFWQTPHDHLKGAGCPKCGRKKTIASRKYTKESYIGKANKIHNNFYDYSLINLDSKDSKINIICPIHGVFKQSLHAHLQGQGCPICGRKKNVLSTEDFIKKAKKIHGNKYDYSNSNYTHSKLPLKIICPIHGEFLQTPETHFHNCGCPKCGNIISKSETEIYEYCCNLLGKENVIQRDRVIIAPKELDIYIPSLKIGIEYNGLRWHSEEFGKNKKYHYNKMMECQNKGIKLIQVFEDEYISHKEIVLAKIRHLLKCDNCPKIMGRKCEIREINNSIAKAFLEQNHIQGYVRSSVYLGAYYNNNLIAVMTFKKEKNNKWELTRFASDYNFICEGIGGKLFKYFIRNYEFSEIKSFADRRWTINEEHNIYTNLGFKKKCYLEPEYRYFKEEDGIERQHKFGFRKQILHKKYGLPLTMTEKEMTEQLGYSKIWDCGLIKYVYKKEGL